MKEYSRELSIFGNFAHIKSDNVREKLKELKDEYGFQYGTVQDLSVTIMPAPIRPALSSEDGKTTLVIGINRIYFQQDDGDIDEYDDFITKGVDILSKTMNVLGISAVRMAINGSFIDIDEEIVRNIYITTFNEKSIFYNQDSTEWDFTLSSQDDSADLSGRINQVIKVVRGNKIIGKDGTVAGPMAIVYDYNTAPTPDAKFLPNDIKVFSKIASNFREKVKEYGRQ